MSKMQKILLPIAAALFVLAFGTYGMKIFSSWPLPRIWVGFILGLLGLILLARAMVTTKLRLYFLSSIFFIFGVVSSTPAGSFIKGLGLHPSPFCTIVKPIQFTRAGYNVPVGFISILVFAVLISIIGNKLFCGWNCPIGAIQELFHKIPLKKKLKIKLPFLLTNSIRGGLFLVFLFLIITSGYNIYGRLNAFDFLHWKFQLSIIPIFTLTLAAALFIYRPFCYLICPFGLITWIFEQASIFRIRIDKKKCNDCKACELKAPCPSIPAIREENILKPDCHACGRCIETCREGAINFGF